MFKRSSLLDFQEYIRAYIAMFSPPAHNTRLRNTADGAIQPTSEAATMLGFECPCCCRSRSIAAWSIPRALIMSTGWCQYRHCRRCHQLQKQTRLNKQAKTQRKKADGAIQSASGRHPNWVPTAASGGLGALLPFLSSTYSVSLTAVSIPTPTPSPQ